MTSLLDGCKESVDARQDKALSAHNAGAAITLQDCLRSFRIESGPNLRCDGWIYNLALKIRTGMVLIPIGDWEWETFRRALV
ncbi:hypothetical protein J6590_029599 [Homalodisca vitripennis]|nr:hypothetical protein J6590_029599 [Homalodisca vitripennis]